MEILEDIFSWSYEILMEDECISIMLEKCLRTFKFLQNSFTLFWMNRPYWWNITINIDINWLMSVLPTQGRESNNISYQLP